MAGDNGKENPEEEDMPELMARTNNNNNDDEYYSSDEDDSIYKPDDKDNESVNNTDTDIAGVYEDENTGVPSTPEETQDNNDNDLHSEPGDL
eukprot:4442933-Ditylum_brightwellii.AAC.1